MSVDSEDSIQCFFKKNVPTGDSEERGWHRAARGRVGKKPTEKIKKIEPADIPQSIPSVVRVPRLHFFQKVSKHTLKMS